MLIRCYAYYHSLSIVTNFFLLTFWFLTVTIDFQNLYIELLSLLWLIFVVWLNLRLNHCYRVVMDYWFGGGSWILFIHINQCTSFLSLSIFIIFLFFQGYLLMDCSYILQRTSSELGKWIEISKGDKKTHVIRRRLIKHHVLFFSLHCIHDRPGAPSSQFFPIFDFQAIERISNPWMSINVQWIDKRFVFSPDMSDV